MEDEVGVFQFYCSIELLMNRLFCSKALSKFKAAILLVLLGFFPFSIISAQTVYTLDDCIRLALDNNPDVKVAGLMVMSAATEKRGSLSAILPTLSYSAGSFQQGSYFNPQFGFPIPESEYHSAGLSLNQNIYDGGRWWNQIAAGSNSYRFSVESELGTRVNTVWNVKQAFYQYLKDAQLLEVVRQQVEVAEQQVERVQRQYDVEQVAKSDLLKQKVFLGDMRVQYLNQQAAVKNSFNQLATLMGMDIDTDFSVIDEPEEATSIEDYSDFWEGVKANHPSLITKRTQIAGAILSLKISRASYLPTLSASFGFDGSSDVFEELYSDVDKNWRQQLRLTISYPLFTGLTRSSQVEKAKVAHKIQQEEYDALLKNLRVQFDSVVEQLENVQETIPIYRESKVSAEEDLRLAQERYNLGAATILEVLDAQLSVARANGSLVRTTYDRRILRAQLDAMMSKM